MDEKPKIVFKPLLKRFEPLYKSKGIRHIVMAGGRFSAKSWAAAEAVIYYTSKFKVNALCTRMVQKSIEKSSKQLIKNTIIRLGLLDQYEIQRDIITHKVTGSTIIFVGLHDEQAIRSMEDIGLVWVEEAQSVTEPAASSLGPTIRKKNALFIWTLNPIRQSDYMSKRFLVGTPPSNALVIRINIHDIPRETIPDDIWEEMEIDKAENYGRYLHIWEGKFLSEGDNRLFAGNLIHECNARVTKHNMSLKPVAGLDVGGGGDPSVLTIRRGDKFEQWRFNVADHMQLVSKVWEITRDALPQGANLCIDAGALGWDVHHLYNSFAQNKHSIVKVQFGESPTCPNEYKSLNRRAEMFQRLRGAMRKGLSLQSQYNKELVEELEAITCWETDKGLLQIEKKENIKKILGTSTDHVDSLALTYALPDAPVETYTHVWREPPRQF